MLSRFSLANRKEGLLILMPVGVPKIAFELTDLVVVHRHGPEVVKQAIFCIEERVGRSRLFQRCEHSLQQLLIEDRALEHIGRNAVVYEGSIGFSIRKLLAENILIDNERNETDATQTGEIGASSCTHIDLEEIVFAGARIVFDVEVSISLILRSLQEFASVLDDGGLTFAQNAKWVTKRGGAVILKGSDAARYRNQVSFCIAEGVENAQRFVATGDEVLNQEIAIVVRGAHVLPHLCKLCGRFDFVSFSFVGNIRILELRGVGGLCYTGVRKSIERKRFRAFAACAEIPGLGCGMESSSQSS